MEIMGLNNLTALVGFGLLACLFLILAKPLKDPELLSEYPYLNSRVFRLLLVMLLTFLLADIVDPGRSAVYSWCFRTTLLFVAGYFLNSYKEDRLAVDVQIVDGSEFEDLPYTHYVEQVPGVFLRACKGSGNFVIPKEAEFAETLARFSPEKFAFIFFQVSGNSAGFPWHKHPKSVEIVFLSEGTAEIAAGLTAEPWVPITTPAGHRHRFRPLNGQDCFGIAILER